MRKIFSSELSIHISTGIGTIGNIFSSFFFLDKKEPRLTGRAGNQEKIKISQNRCRLYFE
jgi:hypothetical protein